MTEYVLVYAQNANAPEALALLVEKDKPEWQKGRLNLPGGKVEPGESPEQAAARELYEEAGYVPVGQVKLLGKLVDGPATIYCCKAVVAVFHDPRPRDEETQKVHWLYWQDVIQDRRLIPNLRVIIPLLRADITDWTIRDEYRSSEQNVHGISIDLPTYKDVT